MEAKVRYYLMCRPVDPATRPVDPAAIVACRSDYKRVEVLMVFLACKGRTETRCDDECPYSLGCTGVLDYWSTMIYAQHINMLSYSGACHLDV